MHLFVIASTFWLLLAELRFLRAPASRSSFLLRNFGGSLLLRAHDSHSSFFPEPLLLRASASQSFCFSELLLLRASASQSFCFSELLLLRVSASQSFCFSELLLFKAMLFKAAAPYNSSLKHNT
jgi:hypothetical protein